MTDTTYEAAMLAKLDQQAAGLGADLGADPVTVAALSEQLSFLRNNPVREDETLPMDDGELHVIIGWDCDHEAQIILGRLADRGWRLVQS